MITFVHARPGTEDELAAVGHVQDAVGVGVGAGWGVAESHAARHRLLLVVLNHSSSEIGARRRLRLRGDDLAAGEGDALTARSFDRARGLVGDPRGAERADVAVAGQVGRAGRTNAVAQAASTPRARWSRPSCRSCCSEPTIPASRSRSSPTRSGCHSRRSRTACTDPAARRPDRTESRAGRCFRSTEAIVSGIRRWSLSTVWVASS